MYRLYSALIGLLVAIMIAVNGRLSNTVGNNLAVVIIHIVGLICIGTLLIITGKKIHFKRGIPIYFYSAGAIGVFTVMASNISFNVLGASLTFALSLLGQTVASIFVDHYGLLGVKEVKFRKEKLIGLILISLGILVMILY